MNCSDYYFLIDRDSGSISLYVCCLCDLATKIGNRLHINISSRLTLCVCRAQVSPLFDPPSPYAQIIYLKGFHMISSEPTWCVLRA